MEKHTERLNASRSSCTRKGADTHRGKEKSLTHSFQSGSLEQTAHHCQGLELKETSQEEEEEDETIESWSVPARLKGTAANIPKSG